MEPPRVLVVDDDPLTLKLLEKTLSLAGYDVVKAQSGTDALERLRGQVFAAAVVDIRMPGMDGIQLLREIKRHDPAIEVVMTTAHPEVSTAVEALKEGAYDYLQKPLNLDELRHRMGRVIERRFLRSEVSTLRNRLGVRLAARELIGVSRPMVQLKETIARVAPTDAAVLVEGETGTGKELVAAAIHRLSPRSQAPFIPVNCGAIPADLMESEFFGHVRGAFTGAVADTLGLFRSAHGGTLFLDEVGELPPVLQVKLLRVLQEKEVRPVGSTRSHAVDFRIIAATNRPLEQAVSEGRFRQDLFYRLNVVRVEIPPLRDRREDIPVLLTHFLREFNERFGQDVREVTPQALAALQAYQFPGNVRELENLLERAYALGATRAIGLADLPALSPAPAVVTAPQPLVALAELERELILRALRLHANRDHAARSLGISQRTLYRRMKEYGIR
ncbi:MAG TPA: sigma-54 dependent transcriptional regulator [Methylomirabilota bacterium]|nr:sigma-54 dependent transcriptional regulator [Methylomirabilota bacterium]